MHKKNKYGDIKKVQTAKKEEKILKIFGVQALILIQNKEKTTNFKFAIKIFFFPYPLKTEGLSH